MSSQMETLGNKFNYLITKYQNTYQDYINTINSNDNSFTSIDNSAFISENNMNIIKNTTKNKCLTSCVEKSACSGATFDNQQNTCSLNTGNGNIIRSENKTAIVKQTLYYSYKLQQINDELIKTNNSIMNLAKNNSNTFRDTQKNTTKKADILKKNYNTLQQERIEIEELIKQYETLNSAYENGNINVKSNYYSYLLYLCITILLVFLLFKFNLSGQQKGGGVNKKTTISVLLVIILIFYAIKKVYF